MQERTHPQWADAHSHEPASAFGRRSRSVSYSVDDKIDNIAAVGTSSTSGIVAMATADYNAAGTSTTSFSTTTESPGKKAMSAAMLSLARTAGARGLHGHIADRAASLKKRLSQQSGSAPRSQDNGGPLLATSGQEQARPAGGIVGSRAVTPGIEDMDEHHEAHGHFVSTVDRGGLEIADYNNQEENGVLVGEAPPPAITTSDSFEGEHQMEEVDEEADGGRIFAMQSLSGVEEEQGSRRRVRHFSFSQEEMDKSFFNLHVPTCLVEDEERSEYESCCAVERNTLLEDLCSSVVNEHSDEVCALAVQSHNKQSNCASHWMRNAVQCILVEGSHCMPTEDADAIKRTSRIGEFPGSSLSEETEQHLLSSVSA
eukprot:GSA25T00016017001.1